MPFKSRTSKPSEPQLQRRLRWLVDVAAFAALLVATCILYAGDLRLGFFQVDDHDYVLNNPWIKEVNSENIRYILTTPYAVNYSPMHLLSYMLDYAIAGLNPYVFHLSSNLWAGIVAGFVYLLSLQLAGKRSVAIAAGTLFVAHPAHVEAVAWISSRKDLVAAAFALPAMIAYFHYRKQGPRANAWLAGSLVCFALAIAGKQSVVVLPVILLAFDLFVERRKGWLPWLEKIPYGLIAAFFASRTIGAQPATGYQLDLYTMGHSVAKSLWLLPGLAEYVQYRPRPDPAAAVPVRILFALVPVAALVVPILVRQWIKPWALALWIWIVLALLPPQFLNFVHPVADRYVFFSSAAAALLIAWSVLFVGQKWGRIGLVGGMVFISVVTGVWAAKSYAYLSEWRDPRSVWYAATKKSDDVETYFNLGAHYHNAAIALDGTIRAGAPVPDDVRRLAEKVWADDPRLPALLAEWQPEPGNRAVTREFQKHLFDLAWNEYEEAVPRRGGRIMPNLYFRRGAVLTERGNFDAARKEFQFAYELSQRHTYFLVRQELTVRYYYALGLVDWKAGNHEAALRWLRKAQDEQIRLGRTWVPELAQYCAQLEGIIRARTPQQSSPAN